MLKRDARSNPLFFLKYSRDQASSRVRGFYMVEELERRGLNCGLVYGFGKRIYIEFLLKLMSYNIIYFQKRYSEIDVKLNKLARLVGKKTIFDIDDAPFGVSLNYKVGEQATMMMKASSSVVVGSHKLRDFVRNFNNHVYLIPSSINLNYYKTKKENKGNNYTTLGWIGNGINYKQDLLMLIRPLEKIGRKYNIKLIIVGAFGQKEIHEGFSRMKNVVVEIVDSINWENPIATPSVISNFDIGLYPLLDKEYNQYKCGFKALEYMAMGIPVVASPIGENKFMVENGKDGFLALNEDDWEKSISYLIENKSIQEKMGKRGRSKVETDYSLEVCASKLINVFKKL